MNVLIVEDEPLAVERLEKLLKDYDPSIEVLERLDTVQEATDFMKRNGDRLDLVFLDIQLSDGKSFEIFNKINYPHPVLFTTAYDEYALDAFKLNSIDYLLKPVKPEELTAALNKFQNLQKGNHKVPIIDKKLIDALLLQHANRYKQRFLVKIGNRIQFKSIDEAAYFVAEDKICYLAHFPSGKKFIIDHTLEELEESLLDPTKFFRISRKHIIQLQYIQEIKTNDNRIQIILSVPSSEKLIVSRGRANDFKSWLNK